MKKFSKIGTLVLAVSFGMAFSQPGEVDISLAATGQLPMGDFEPGLGLGGLAGVEVGATPGLALTARSGYIYHMKKDHITFFSQVPIMGGGKLTVPMSPIYLAGELGAVITNFERDDGGVLGNSDVSGQNTNFGWDVGLGAEVGAVDLRLTFNVLDASSTGDAMTLGMTLGFTL